MSADRAGRSLLLKNPFAIAFVVGVVFLTALPLLQRRFLKAPPPLRSLGSWVLVDGGGRTISSETLRGRVWIASFLPQDCREGCLESLKAFQKTGSYLSDFGNKGLLVTFAERNDFDVSAVPAATGDSASVEWLWLTGPDAALRTLVYEGFRAAFVATIASDAGATESEFWSVPALALVDQNGAIRGFWRNDDVGRGNIINAARLLLRYGPSP